MSGKAARAAKVAHMNGVFRLRCGRLLLFGTGVWRHGNYLIKKLAPPQTWYMSRTHSIEDWVGDDL